MVADDKMQAWASAEMDGYDLERRHGVRRSAEGKSVRKVWKSVDK